ncbi:MAG: hypothetical protein RLZ98_3152 [Pseudomonadota bacterium]|jgi:hypothetical protein
MIRYSLICKEEHEFEGWFRNSDDYDRQRKRGLVRCPTCSSKKISKALMAPSVVTSPERRRRPTVPAVSDPEPLSAVSSPPAGVPQPALSPEATAEFLAAVRRFRKKVEAEAEYVGPRFAEEARRIHHEEAEERSIYGEASITEAKELLDEGIPLTPLPRLPEDEN